MGGFGSGHYCRTSGKYTVEHYRRTYIGLLAKRGLLEPGVEGPIYWNRGGKPDGSITVKAGIDSVTFTYSLTINGGEPEIIEQHIRVERTPCHFGGSRPWFTCPSCHNRVGLLVIAGRLFTCRKCSNLAYACQLESKSDRASRRIRKIQKRLGNEEWQNVLDIWLPKPKGMHWKTYNRIVAQADKPLRIFQSEMAAMCGIDWVKIL